MLHFSRTFAAMAACVLLLVGCTIASDGRHHPMVAGASPQFRYSWAQLHRDMPRSEVYQLLGKPTGSHRVAGQVYDTWLFQIGKPLYRQSPSNWAYVVVYDSSGRVSGFATPFK